MRRWTSLFALLVLSACAALPARSADGMAEKLRLAREVIALGSMAHDIARLPASAQDLGKEWQCVATDDLRASTAWTVASERAFESSEIMEYFTAAYAAEFSTGDLAQLIAILKQPAMQKSVALALQEDVPDAVVPPPPRPSRNVLERIEREPILLDIMIQDDAVDSFTDWLVDMAVSCSLSRMASGLEPMIESTAAVVVSGGMRRQDHRRQAVSYVKSYYEDLLTPMTTEELIQIRDLQSREVWQRSAAHARRILGKITRDAAIRLGEEVAAKLRAKGP